MDASSLEHLNILYAYHTSPDYMAPARLSARQVSCGPYFQDHSDGDQVVSLATPVGRYDVAPLLARLPASQQPDLFIVKADASRTNFPCNLQSLSCPRVLLVGDTQHMQAPLQTMLSYARSEPFDVILTDHGRRNLHFFTESGLKNTFWMPGLNLNIWPLASQALAGQAIERPLAFVGQMGDGHPVRVGHLSFLQQHGFPLHVERAPQQRAAEIYASSQINLNCSLNGDVNLRVFEVLAHGGLLLTDALKPQAGLEALFDPDRELVTWKDSEDLGRQVQRLLQEPELCRQIAAAGRQRLEREHHPQQRRRQLADILDGKPVPDYLAGAWDRRTVALSPLSAAFYQHVAFYEVMQGANRGTPSFSVLFTDTVAPALSLYSCDLSRFTVACLLPRRDSARRQQQELHRQAGVEGQIALLSADEAARQSWNTIAAHARDLLDPAFTTLLGRQPPNLLYLEDLALTLRNTPLGSDAVAGLLDSLGLQPWDRLPGLFVTAGVAAYLQDAL